MRIPQRYEEFSKHFDVTRKCLTTGLTPTEAQNLLGFEITKLGDYIPCNEESLRTRNNSRKGLGLPDPSQDYRYDPKYGYPHGPDIPHEKNEFNHRRKPRPY